MRQVEWERVKTQRAKVIADSNKTNSRPNKNIQERHKPIKPQGKHTAG
jgi:hypothetical protein